jgi:hypothetical protein
MGYTTEFVGCFKINKPLDPITANLINGINRTRRMARDLTKLGFSIEESDGYGIDGEFYYPPITTDFGQEHDESILDYNYPPRTQPGLWCHWYYNEQHQYIAWDDGEKFYEYIEWLEYLIHNILEPEYVLNGTVKFQGEDEGDRGVIKVIDNVLTVFQKQNIHYPDNYFNKLFNEPDST